MAAKDHIRKEKLNEAISGLSMAASAMNHHNYALRGGTFPPPTLTQSHVNNNTIGGVSISEVFDFPMKYVTPNSGAGDKVSGYDTSSDDKDDVDDAIT